jgi:hypothetical protein
MTAKELARRARDAPYELRVAIASARGTFGASDRVVGGIRGYLKDGSDVSRVDELIESLGETTPRRAIREARRSPTGTTEATSRRSGIRVKVVGGKRRIKIYAKEIVYAFDYGRGGRLAQWTATSLASREVVRRWPNRTNAYATGEGGAPDAAQANATTTAQTPEAVPIAANTATATPAAEDTSA